MNLSHFIYFQDMHLKYLYPDACLISCL